MYQNVLVATDGSEGGVCHAVDLAASFGSKLHAVYAFDSSALEALPEEKRTEAVGTVEAAGSEATSRVAERASEVGVEVAQDVREGVPYETVLEYLREKDIDIAVLRNPAARSSVAEDTGLRILRLYSIPVMTVPDTSSSGYDDIVVATDGSNESTEAAEHAVRIADAYGGRVHGIYVVDTDTYAHGDASGSVVGMLKEGGEKALDEVARKAEDAGVPVSRSVVKGTPHREILRKSEEVGADAVAVGKHGRGESEFIGSTTQRVVRSSRRPVLTVG
jgi:nucleotide-binding universal stress UspA family protein